MEDWENFQKDTPLLELMLVQLGQEEPGMAGEVNKMAENNLFKSKG